MSQRPGIQITVENPADGGDHPNRYLPYISAHIRAYWPAHAPLRDVLDSIHEAHERAIREATQKWRDTAPHLDECPGCVQCDETKMDLDPMEKYLGG